MTTDDHVLSIQYGFNGTGFTTEDVVFHCDCGAKRKSTDLGTWDMTLAKAQVWFASHEHLPRLGEPRT